MKTMTGHRAGNVLPWQRPLQLHTVEVCATNIKAAFGNMPICRKLDYMLWTVITICRATSSDIILWWTPFKSGDRVPLTHDAERLHCFLWSIIALQKNNPTTGLPNQVGLLQ